MKWEEYIDAGFTVVGNEASGNKLVQFLKENYPSVIKDNELDLNELKTIAGLPVDEKVNGYGLNFVGRNFARAKYAKKTTKELKLNTQLSKNIDTTENLLLKGDNLDSLKILKSYYTGKIKCIYIDPPYNTASDEFVYPDKFDKEEAEVLGFAHLSEDDFARMAFSFKTKKSHNGWLSFMYPRLLLARDLMREDGVIFISIDDNEQANLKLLCDEVFGEENCVGTIIVINNPGGRDYGGIAKMHEYLVGYVKSPNTVINNLSQPDKVFTFFDDISGFEMRELRNRNITFNKENRPNLYYPFYINENKTLDNGLLEISLEYKDNYVQLYPKASQGVNTVWRWGKDKAKENINVNIAAKKMKDGGYMIIEKYRQSTVMARSVWSSKDEHSEKGTILLKALFSGEKLFDFPKPLSMIKKIIEIGSDTDSISRIYNMIFTVGLDEPTQVPEEVVQDCIYRIGNHYYLTNSEKISVDDYANVIRNAFWNSAKGQVFIDGWTASINETLQSYKEEVKIVF